MSNDPNQSPGFNPYAPPTADGQPGFSPYASIEGDDAYIDATTGQRFGTYIIDVICFMVASGVIGFIFGIAGMAGIFEDPILSRLFGGGIFIGYYVILEATTGKTIGKMLVGTKVIREDGGKPSAAQIIGRSFCRMIPFEPFSAFGSSSQMWHDRFSGTRVIQG